VTNNFMVQNYVMPLRHARFGYENDKTKKGRPNGQPFLSKIAIELFASLTKRTEDDQEVTNSRRAIAINVCWAIACS